MKYKFFVSWVLSIFLVGCSTSVSRDQQQIITETPVASSTPTASQSPSPIPTQTATITPSPTLTPTPTITPSPTLMLPIGPKTPLPENIPTLSADNIQNIQLIASMQWEQDTRLFSFGIAIHPNGKIVALGNYDGSIDLVNLENREIIQRIEGNKKPLYALIFDQEGKYLYSGGESTFFIWDVEADDRVTSLSISDQIFNFDISPDGTLLAYGTFRSATSGNVDVRKLPEMILVKRLPLGSWVKDVSFSEDGQMLAAAAVGDKVAVWNVNDWSIIQKIIYTPMYKEGDISYYPSSVQFANHDQQLIVGFTGSASIFSYDLISGEKSWQTKIVGSNWADIAVWNDVIYATIGEYLQFIDSADGNIIYDLDRINICYDGKPLTRIKFVLSQADNFSFKRRLTHFVFMAFNL